MATKKSSTKKSIETRRNELADRLIDDAERLRVQLFAPVTVKKVVVLPVGNGQSEAEIVEVELTEPTFADKRLIVASIAQVVDKLSALTAGTEPANADVDADWTAPPGTRPVPSKYNKRVFPSPNLKPNVPAPSRSPPSDPASIVPDWRRAARNSAISTAEVEQCWRREQM